MHTINANVTFQGHRRRTIASVAALAFLGLAGTTGSASAVALLNGSTLSVNGLDIIVAGCSLTLGGAAQASCAPGNLEIVEDTTGPGASIRIQGVGGGNIFSAALGAGLYDVTFTLNITSTLPVTVSEARLGISGSAIGVPFLPVAIGGLVSAGENIIGTSNDGNMNVNLAGGPTTVSRAFSPVTSFSVVKDLKLNAAVPGLGFLTLASVTQSYLPAPEPATIGLMLAGVGGMALVRRRKARLAS